MIETFMEYKEMTDEEIYQFLKEDKSLKFMNSEEWKKLRLIQLKEEGKIWSF